MSFKKGFEKEAGVVGSALKAVGKGVLKATGGPIGAALTAVGAANDFGDASAKMQKARQGLL